MLIHAFFYDSSFLNTASILDPVLKSGGVCVLSSQSLSYFVSPQEFPDERALRATDLTTTMRSRPRLVIDQSEFASFLNDTVTVWTQTERENLFAIIDQLCFAYTANATAAEIDLSLAVWSQYVAASHAYSTTATTANVYLTMPAVAITCPDYVTFTFAISNGTHYQLRIWLSNTRFYAKYPLSTIRAVVPPLPLDMLYTLSIANSTANVFTTALETASTNQQVLQSYIQSGQYSGYVAYSAVFVDGSGDTAQVQFNLLYNGCAPGAIAIRNAIRLFLINSGVGTADGWRNIAPSLFVTELFYMVPMWDQTTSLISSIIYPSITPMQRAISGAETVLYDLSTETVSANLNILTSFYNTMTILAVPDTENDPTRRSLATEHPTYRDVATTDMAFVSMTAATQQFATLLGAALSVAFGNTSTNPRLSIYTPPGDNRTYVTFSVMDIEYYVMTKTTYLALVTP